MATANSIKNRFGRLTGWNDITLNLFGRDVEGFDEIEYSVEKDAKPEYGSGPDPIGYSVGNNNPKLSFSLYEEEVRSIRALLPPGSNLTDIPAFDVVVTVEVGGRVVKDIIRNVVIKNDGKSGKQGEGKSVMKFDCMCTHIEFNAV